ncbi:DUF924 family protein [Neopusillimonas maritima]|uniref:DUF924 family protein n=2 Tax=Neopusillimonas maritima TaxID=2026239 RepID=UPI0037047F61
MHSAHDVLNFWFHELTPKQWFDKDDALDAEVRERFSQLHHRAALCELYEWRKTPQGRLAEIIVLDQFSRNIYRNQSRAFACDPLALALAQEAVAQGLDKQFKPPQLGFLYLPYMLSVIGVMEPPVIVNIGPVMIEIIEPIRDRNYRASW